MPAKMRADLLLVKRGLFESRAQAQAAIEAGRVAADAVPVTKASETLALDARLEAEPAHPWVSRGGVKLDHALDALGFNVSGRVCLDVGASTGGFTDVLLARGAKLVYALDVGRDQLHARLRADARIVSLEQTDIRTLDATRLDPQPDFVTIDVSFISLKAVLPAVTALVAGRHGRACPGHPRLELRQKKDVDARDEGGHSEKADRQAIHLVALVKPQFEVGRAYLKKGIVRDAAKQAQACEEIAACLNELGWSVVRTFPSPIHGGDGNAEFLVGATRASARD